MCCDGTLFDVVRLVPAEVVARDALVRLGARLRELGQGQGWMAPQPCRALAGRTCRIYEDRPGRCHAYRCHLLEALAADEVDLAEAQSIAAVAHTLTGHARERYLDRHFRGRHHKES